MSGWADDGGEDVGGDGEDVAKWVEVFGSGFDDEDLAVELAAGAPWVPVSAGDVGRLVAEYRAGRELVGALLAGLVAAGFEPGEFPQLCAGLDADGRAVVHVGMISAGTLARLVVLLTARPTDDRGAVVPLDKAS